MAGSMAEDKTRNAKHLFTNLDEFRTTFYAFCEEHDMTIDFNPPYFLPLPKPGLVGLSEKGRAQEDSCINPVQVAGLTHQEVDRHRSKHSKKQYIMQMMTPFLQQHFPKG